jgi:hypothetical protein
VVNSTVKEGDQILVNVNEAKDALELEINQHTEKAK